MTLTQPRRLQGEEGLWSNTITAAECRKRVGRETRSGPCLVVVIIPGLTANPATHTDHSLLQTQGRVQFLWAHGKPCLALHFCAVFMRVGEEKDTEH